MPLNQWDPDTWTWTGLRGALDQNVKKQDLKDQNAITKQKGTELQFKIWTVFEKNWTVSKIEIGHICNLKRNLDLFAILTRKRTYL